MSFLTPLFWLGLAATAVPIIVHLVRRTRAPRVEFPSLMFVRRIPQRTIRRRSLQNLLLLILRCLAFFLLVFAFVRPYSSSSGSRLDQNANVEVILLDRSFSMRVGQRFERARARASQLINDRAPARRALVVFDHGYEVISQPTEDRPRLAAELASVQPGDGGTGLDQALRAAESLLRSEPGGQRTIHLLTDFQASSRHSNESPYFASAGVRVVPFDAGENGGENSVSNLAISEVNGIGTIHQPKYTDRLTARISNYGAENVNRVRVELRLNDRSIEKRELSVAARDSRTIEFTGFNLNEGLNQASIVIEGDTLSIDNRYDLTLERRARAKALIIETVTRGGNRDESLYLRNALTTGENSPFEVEVRSAGTVNPADLKNYRLVIINDASLGSMLATALLKELEAGLSVIVAFGPHTDQNGFNRTLGEGLGLSLGEMAGERGDYVTISETLPDHPIFEPFRQAGRLPATRVRQYRRLDPGPGPKVIARYDNGAPAILETGRNRGRVIAITTTLDTGWNDLPLTPYYLPLLRQMTRYLVEREARLARTVGETVPIERAADGSLPSVDTPSGKRLVTGDIIPLNEAGLYRLRYADRSEVIAVNIDRRESDLTRLDLNEVATAINSGARQADSSNALLGPAMTGPEEPARIEARQSFWLYLLIAALLLFITEGIIARRIRMARMIN